MAEDCSSTLCKWFPTTKDSWQLDAVNLLAIIGEASMADNAQPMTASMLCLLPRILPAPQALLKPTRPSRLPTYKAQMVGVHNGVLVDSVGFFANIIHPLEDQPAHSFKVFRIDHRVVCDEKEDQASIKRIGETLSTMFLPRSTARTRRAVRASRQIPGPPAETGEGGQRSGASRNGVNFAEDVEKGVDRARYNSDEPIQGIRRRRTARDRITEFVANPEFSPQQRPAVPPALTSPIHIITVLSFLMTLTIFGLTAYWQDGNALLATFIISLQASLVGYASWWKPQLMTRPTAGPFVPDGDMMIRTREGAFILVKCSEDVARELYTGTEECQYHVNPRNYRIYMAIGTMLLMCGVVLLGVTNFNAQALIGGSYILLNGAYWLLGMLPKSLFWDLSRYKWEDVTPKDSLKADESLGAGVEGVASFTRTLWYAIRETKQTGWVERSGAAPGTPQWRQWLREARENAEAGKRNWPAVARKDHIISEGVMRPVAPGEPKTDQAEQRAPRTLDHLRASGASEGM